MKLGYNLTIEQSQKLVMTPELIQAIQILQFNTQELDSYVEEQLLINPVLEQKPPEESDYKDVAGDEKSVDRDEIENSSKDQVERDEMDWKEYIKSRQYDDISYRQYDSENSDPDNDNTYERYTSADVTLAEHLMFQLQFASKKKGCRNLGRYIIESLDGNGYMTLSVDEIAKYTKAAPDKIKEVLDIIHSFDPVGVGARDLAECLTIQLQHSGQWNEMYEKMLIDHLEDLADNRLLAISKDLGICVKEVQRMGDVIKTLEPKPGRAFASQGDTRYVVPDVIVEKIDDQLVVTVNDSSSPKLIVSSYYKKLLSEAENDSNLNEYLSDRFNSAVWLIKSIDQRKQTICNVVKAVVKYQKDFFDKGSKHLKPLTLKQIAEDVGIHESTVSRSINGKYLQSPRGVFEIKYFFSAGVAADKGGISSNSIKSFIKEIIDAENSKKPFSDQAIAEKLKAKGMEISRRTVAKYRDEMNILSSSKRRRY